MTKWSSPLSSISAQENLVPATYAESGTDSDNRLRIFKKQFASLSYMPHDRNST